MTALLLVVLLGLTGAGQVDRLACRKMVVTGYVRSAHGPRTYDGTPIGTPEPIAAASWDVPLGHYVLVEDAGLYRVADRGAGLGPSGWVDIAVWTLAEAYALTSTRTVCLFSPAELGVGAP